MPPPPGDEPSAREGAASCCGGGTGAVDEEGAAAGGDCCGKPARRRDWLLWGSGLVILPAYLAHLLAPGWTGGVPWWGAFSMGVFELMNRMWWGLLAGVLAVGLISRVPRDLVIGALGRGGGPSGLLRAIGAGVLLDLCSHGILLVGTQLYRRGASLGQTAAFLIASPWNSLSLTLILFSLIGLGWTLAFVALSAAVALLAGLGFEWLVKRGSLPPNPHRVELPADFRWLPEARRRLAATRFDRMYWKSVIRAGWIESRMILRWIFFGAILAAGIRASLSEESFGTWFGPTLAGLGLTLLATTIIEVCSEGSSPVAADLLTRGGAPGNAFTFLMAGVATDYTEIFSLREATGSTKIALFLPLLTVPQILLIGWVLNQFAVG